MASLISILSAVAIACGLISASLILLPIFFRRIEGVAQAYCQGLGLVFFLLTFLVFALWLVV